MKDMYQWDIDNISESFLTEDAYKTLLKNKKDNDTIILKEWTQLMKDRDDLRYKYYPDLSTEVETMLSPVNLERLIHQMIDQFQIEEYDQSDITPLEAINIVLDLVNYVSHYNINNNFSPLLKILIRSTLSSKRWIESYVFLILN